MELIKDTGQEKQSMKISKRKAAQAKEEDCATRVSLAYTKKVRISVAAQGS